MAYPKPCSIYLRGTVTQPDVIIAGKLVTRLDLGASRSHEHLPEGPRSQIIVF